MSEIVLVLNELRHGQPIDGKKVARLINAHKDTRKHQVELHERYKCSKLGVPIFTRTFMDRTKINANLNNDFFSDIVDTKVGYLLGIPITYTYMEPEKSPDGSTNQSELQVKKLVDKKLSDFIRRENVPEVDAECVKFATICGIGARLCYLGEDGIDHIQNVYPWECIFLVDDNDIQRPEYALRYWEELVSDGNSTKTVYKAEFYDNKTITYFRQEKSSSTNPQELLFVPDPDEQPNPRPHMFTYCPLIGFPNNNELLGDCEKVISLIDAYDRTLSDLSSELEQMRLAYMLLHGVGNVDDDFITQIKKTGAIGFAAGPNQDGGGDARFIEKNLNDTAIEHHLDRLCNDIYYFSGSPNFRDAAFSGNISGVALKFKLFKLEAKCITAEREISSGLTQMFRVLGGKWQIEEVQIDPDKVEFQFKRNFPLNLNDEATTTVQLRGQISEKTRLGLLSFIPNPDEELEAMAKDNEGMVNLDQVPLDNQNQNNQVTDQAGQAGANPA